MRRCLGWVCATCSLPLVCVLVVDVAEQPPATQKPKIKQAIVIPIASIDGKDNYDAYCAVCHGTSGKGDGPAAPAMKAPVPDLTTIAQRNDGKFAAAAVERIIQGVEQTPTPAHGIETMPIWGDVFHSEDKVRATLRIRNLVGHLESIQAKK